MLVRQLKHSMEHHRKMLPCAIYITGIEHWVVFPLHGQSQSGNCSGSLHQLKSDEDFPRIQWKEAWVEQYEISNEKPMTKWREVGH